MIAADVPGFGQLATAATRGRADRRRVRHGVRALLRRAGDPHAARGRQLDGRRHRARARAARRGALGHGDRPGRVLDHARAALLPALAQAAARGPGAGPLAPRSRSPRRRRAGRSLMGQIFARPWRIPPEAARRTLENFWAAPAFTRALAAFDRYTFRHGHELRRAGHVALGQPRPAAPLRPPGAARASQALPRRAPRDARRARPHALLRRSRRSWRGDAGGDSRWPELRRLAPSLVALVLWPCSRAWPAPHRRRSRASAGARTWPRATEAGRSAAGSWTASGLPAYRYRIDEARDPRARRSELEDVADPTDAWSQLGNDHVVANAYNHGYTQLWSQDRVYEWVNRYSAARTPVRRRLRLAARGRADDQHALSPTVRRSAHRARLRRPGTRAGRIAVAGSRSDEHVYAPFGDDPRAAPRRDDPQPHA